MSDRSRGSRRLGGALLAIAVVGAVSCGPAPEAEAPSSTNAPSRGSAASATAAAPTERAFETRGVIREIPASGGVLVVRHEEIPGYMPKMTMELTVRDTHEITGLNVGDVIEFRLVARAEDHFIDRLRKVGHEASKPTAAPQVEEGEPQPPSRELNVGDLMPDFEFTSETGRPLRFSQLHGQAVAFTFFFTRCPLPDFCPLMNRNFERARSSLKASTGGPTNWVFLSISFDAEFDKPQVLAFHAANYRGDDPDRWIFAAASEATVKALARPLDLKVIREAGSYSHNLRTVVLDTTGRVARQFDGNQWKAEELAEALRAAARVTVK